MIHGAVPNLSRLVARPGMGCVCRVWVAGTQAHAQLHFYKGWMQAPSTCTNGASHECRVFVLMHKAPLTRAAHTCTHPWSSTCVSRGCSPMKLAICTNGASWASQAPAGCTSGASCASDLHSHKWSFTCSDASGDLCMPLVHCLCEWSFTCTHPSLTRPGFEQAATQ